MDLQPLSRLVDLVARPGDTREVYAAALDVLLLVLGAERAAVAVVGEAGAMRWVAWRGLSDAYCQVAAADLPWAIELSNGRMMAARDALAEPGLEPLHAMMRADGIRAAAVVPIVSGRRLCGVLAAFYDAHHDFSDAEKSLAQLLGHHVAVALERAEAEAASPSRSEFLSILGHELRNPLNVIVNAAQLLRAPAASEDLKAVAHDILRRQMAHLTRLLDGLLDETRLSRGLVALRPSPIDVRSAVTLAVEELSHRSAIKGQEVELVLPDEPVVLTADADRLQQVVSNLLDNAIRFTAAGGSIRVTVTSDPSGATIRVRDSGIGLPPERLTAIFQPLVQGQRDSEPRSGGLGLGLSIARRLVELHGGTVHADSAGPGKGTEFIVCLPPAPPDQGPADPLEANRISRAREGRPPPR